MAKEWGKAEFIAWLTEHERKQLLAIDARLDFLRDEIAMLSLKRNRINNRAQARKSFAAKFEA